MPDLIQGRSLDVIDFVNRKCMAFRGLSERRLIRFFLLALLVAFFSAEAGAQGMSWGEDYAKLISTIRQIDPVEDSSFGDEVGLYDGATTFNATDISIPGNSGLPVVLSRTWDSQNHGLSQQVVGDWVIDVPNLNGTFVKGNGWQDQRCTLAAPPPGVTASTPPNYLVLQPRHFWGGNKLNVSGSANEMMLSKTNDPKLKAPAVSLGATSPWVTKSGWHFGCLPGVQRGTGEGFIGYSPDGRRYTFDWMVEDVQRAMAKRGVQTDFYFIVPRVVVRIYATKVEDRFGNWVRYEWAGDRLQRIHANDGREISLSYDSAGRLSFATSHGRAWAYNYSTYAIQQQDTHYLSAVTLPDGSQWRYDASRFVRRIVYSRAASDDPLRDAEGFMLRNFGYCNFDRVIQGGGGTYAVMHPSGAHAEYVFTPMRHGRKNVPENCMDTGDSPKGAANYYPLHHDALSLTSKTISGAGVPSAQYQYRYVGLDIGYQPTANSQTNQSLNATPPPNYKTVTVVEPDGTEQIHVFGRDYALNEGWLFRVETRKNGVVSRVVAHEYVQETEIAAQDFPNVVGSSMVAANSWLSSAIRPILRTTITQDGAAFITQVPACSGATYCFDGFGRAVSLTKTNTLGSSKSEVTEYHDDLGFWLLGQVKKQSVLNSSSNADPSQAGTLVVSEAGYNTLAQPIWTKKFGKLQQTLTYNPDGTLATAADGRGNFITLSNWKRGIPQLIQHPATPEAPAGATESATVNDNGWITSVTDENGYATGYGYDAMGRLASIVQPTGDSVAYHNTLMNFRALTDADWKPPGVASGQWRLYEETGSRATITYMDALWRPVLKHEYDAANVGPTLRAVKTGYDTSGRISFQSYPSSDMIPGASGIRTFYDALDRVTRVEQDSELGVLATTTEYLSGLKTRVTNPRGFQTTTSFMAWDQPGYDLPILSEQPEGKVIEIARHPQFGWPQQLKQRNTAGTLQQSRQYVYDTYGQLCKTIEPETGATVMDYDAAGNLSWSAAGLIGATYTGLNDCSQAAAGGSGRVTHRTYDARNRLTNLAFPNGRGNQVWNYTPDGLPASITTYNETGTATPVVNGYSYNRRRLMTGESIYQAGWYNWATGYGYDAYGHLSLQTYHTGLNVDYAPNVYGQPTKAGTFASGAQYYPNGALKQFTYGNGIVHTMTQNARQLPVRVTATGNAMDYDYAYDPNGNVERIYDYVTGTPTPRHRWMGYDGLDRLTSTASAVFGGTDSTHRFTYDALDNMTSWKLAGVKDYADYVYDASTHRLTNIRNSAGATVVGMDYDEQGNLQNKNGQAYEFDYGNRLRNVPGKESYRYDGHGRRVLSLKPDGSNILSMYGSNGQVVLQDHGTKVEEHIYLAGSIVATRVKTWATGGTYSTRYQHTDALGSPVAVSNEAGQVIERNDYEPYGAIIGKPTFSGIGYTGHVMDGATGLTYMQQRYYDESVGRFLSVDPVGVSPINGLNFNRYWYASNNPYKNTDPDGRCDGISTCQIEWEEKAVMNGQMSQEQKQSNDEARGVGALIGVGMVATVYAGGQFAPALPVIGKYLAKRAARQEARRQIKAQAARGIRSLEKRIQEHIKKLEEFRNNPTIRPGMEKLSEEAVRAQQARRIRHLETEIRTFRENIVKLKKLL